MMRSHIVFFLVLCITSCTSDDNYFSLEGADIGKYIVAHRGNWKQHGYPQNSIASLKDAIRMDIYGVELDVRQTKDSVFVINHDSIYSYEIISKSTYSDLNKSKLGNGENLPTLNDFLSVYKQSETKTKLIVELKKCNIRSVLSLIDSYSLLDRVEFVTFQRDYCDELVDLGYGDKVSYSIEYESLALSPSEIKKSGYGGVCYSYNLIDKNKKWISEAANLGVRINVWTVDDLYSIKQYADQGLIVTTNVTWLCVPQNN